MKKFIELEEVSSDFYDECLHCFCVDVWKPDNDEGEVAARVYDNGYVEYTNLEYAHHPEVVCAIAEIISKL